MGYIYKITNKINDKCYIGQTIRNPKLRFWEHTTKSKRNKRHLHKALAIYGKENFNFEIIEKCDNNLLNEREIYWIKFYNSYKYGYNETRGGFTISELKRKPICQYDLIGNFIAEYKGIKEAERKLGLINGSSISNVINHKQYCAYGYIWCLKNEKPIIKKTTTQAKPVMKLTLDNKVVNEYKSIREAVKKNNYKPSAIGRICTCCLKGKIYNGYLWKYKYIIN